MKPDSVRDVFDPSEVDWPVLMDCLSTKNRRVFEKIRDAWNFELPLELEKGIVSIVSNANNPLRNNELPYRLRALMGCFGIGCALRLVIDMNRWAVLHQITVQDQRDKAKEWHTNSEKVWQGAQVTATQKHFSNPNAKRFAKAYEGEVEAGWGGTVEELFFLYPKGGISASAHSIRPTFALVRWSGDLLTYSPACALAIQPAD
jgi:hypothetical protein